MARRRLVAPTHSEPTRPSSGGVLNAPVAIPPRPAKRTSLTVLPSSANLDPSVPDECPTGPCPHYNCRYHLWRVDGHDRRGNPGGRRGNGRGSLENQVRANSAETCALDVARRGPQSATEIARMVGVDSARHVQRMIKRALKKLRAAGVEL